MRLLVERAMRGLKRPPVAGLPVRLSALVLVLLLVLLLVLGAGGVALLLTDVVGDTRSVRPGVREAAASASASAPGPVTLPTSRHAAPRPAPAAAPAASPLHLTAAAPAPALSTSHTCAGVPLQVDAQGTLTNGDALTAEPVAGLLAAVRERLARLPDDRSRAAALLFDGLASQAAPLLADFASDVPARLPAAPAINALATLAARSNDATAYALGFQSCLRYSGDNALAAPACAQLSAAQWARLEPDNAVPWLYQADRDKLAKKTGRTKGPVGVADEADAAGMLEAMQHIAHARRFDTHAEAVQHMALGVLPGGTSPEAETAFAIAMVGVPAAVWQPGYAWVSLACKGEAMRDANRRQLCSEVATAFVERGDTALELAIGRGIGERSGWPAAKVAALRGEEAALLKVAATELGTDFVSCAGATRHAAFLRDRTARGELRALRRLLPSAAQPGGTDPVSLAPGGVSR